MLYQPKLVRASAARRVTPPGVFLLSLAGWTLGGTFCVDWTSSPIGPYREVAVLSGLVVRGGTAGAWASHIIVTSPDAVDAGREFWGRRPWRRGRFEPRASGTPRRRLSLLTTVESSSEGCPPPRTLLGLALRPAWQPKAVDRAGS